MDLSFKHSLKIQPAPYMLYRMVQVLAKWCKILMNGMISDFDKENFDEC